ncbi:hypothetical protein FS842_004895, partial [Serendipita sp. 407]
MITSPTRVFRRLPRQSSTRLSSPSLSQPTRLRLISSSARIMSHNTLTEAIKEDHQEMYDYYEQYRLAKNVDDQSRWSRQLTWEVARHAAGEEIV